jgi:hypothetical protein
VSGITCFCLANAAFDGALGASFIRNHSSTALAIASFTAWFVRLFLVGGTDTATVDVFAATDVDEVEVSFCFGVSPLAARSAAMALTWSSSIKVNALIGN